MKDPHKCSIASEIVLTPVGRVSLEKLRKECEERGICNGECWLPKLEFIKQQITFKGEYLLDK